VALVAWGKVWQTTIGSGSTAVRLAELNVPATIVGYFFEILFAKELQHRFPREWRGNDTGDEKDLVNLKDPALSVEIKTSGQLGLRVFGNRSYGQELQKEGLAKKEKSGYYLTANFYKRTLTLLRFGWIDAADWKPQASQTGQMAGLPDAVYQWKLVVLPGEYRLKGPVELLRGVGAKTAAKLHALKVHTIGDLLDYTGSLPDKALGGIRSAALQEYRPDVKSATE
jgi:ScaI-like restriction endonuclease